MPKKTSKDFGGWRPFAVQCFIINLRKGKDIASFIGCEASTVSTWKRADKVPMWASISIEGWVKLERLKLKEMDAPNPPSLVIEIRHMYPDGGK